MQTFKACGLAVLSTVAPAVSISHPGVGANRTVDVSQRTNNRMLTQDDGEDIFSFYLCKIYIRTSENQTLLQFLISLAGWCLTICLKIGFQLSGSSQTPVASSFVSS